MTNGMDAGDPTRAGGARGFLAELRRRSVIRVAAAYLVGAWALAQVTGLAAATFDAPGWVMRMVIALLVIAFVPVLALAWLFEITPDGVQRDGGRGRAAGADRSRRLDYVVAGALVVGVGLLAASALQTRAPAPAVAEAAESASLALAVLPFANMSPDPGNEHFADGIAEELLNILAGVEGLHVTSRTSAFAFRGAGLSIPEIARRLGVGLVLGGSVRRQGERVRVTAQLIDAGQDAHLWSEIYDRNLADIFQVQEEIAAAIMAAVEPVLGLRPVTVAAPTADLDAYQYFLRGRSSFYDREPSIAIAELSAAVRLDPSFADAWSFLAAAISLGLDDPLTAIEREAMVRLGWEATTRALDLRPDDPLALTSRTALLRVEGRLVDALMVSARAASIDGPETTARLWHGILLMNAGYVHEAVPVFEEAYRLEPMVMPNAGWLGAAYLAAGDPDSGERLIRRAYEIRPNEHWHRWLAAVAVVRANAGDTARAAAIFRVSDRLAERGGSPVSAEELAPFYRALANRSARPAYLAAERAAGARALSRGGARWDNLALGDADSFLESIQEMQRDRGNRYAVLWTWIAWEPGMRWLREDPRFFALMEEVGVVQLWEARGYPPGCRPVRSPGGDRLGC
jgi:adenylate cyclase